MGFSFGQFFKTLASFGGSMGKAETAFYQTLVSVKFSERMTSTRENILAKWRGMQRFKRRAQAKESTAG